MFARKDSDCELPVGTPLDADLRIQDLVDGRAKVARATAFGGNILKERPAFVGVPVPNGSICWANGRRREPPQRQDMAGPEGKAVGCVNLVTPPAPRRDSGTGALRGA